MSKISAEFIDDELIIKKIGRHRESDNDIQRINLVDLVIHREYEAKVNVSNRSQNNKIILMHEVSNEYAMEVAVKRAIKLDKGESEIKRIKDQYTERINNNEMNKRVVCVYVRGNVLYYSYGDLNQIYKYLMEFIYKVVSINLNRNGISMFLYLYIINRFKLDITDKRIEVSEFIKKILQYMKLLVRFLNSRFHFQNIRPE